MEHPKKSLTWISYFDEFTETPTNYTIFQLLAEDVQESSVFSARFPSAHNSNFRQVDRGCRVETVLALQFASCSKLRFFKICDDLGLGKLRQLAFDLATLVACVITVLIDIAIVRVDASCR